MWKNYANFSARTTTRGYWMAFLFNCIISAVLGWLFVMVKLPFLGWLYALVICIPSLAIMVRRLRDAGLKRDSIFFILVPLIGQIVLIVFLCKPSVPEDGVPVV
ncbi:DUF805 domain-containing protein [Christensenellaceae bacterium OttesenSCG-928-L17]|nr:DUF805 domain-containing protein [Christensenellaceae bacterium OttesenSCG-928-L17]